MRASVYDNGLCSRPFCLMPWLIHVNLTLYVLVTGTDADVSVELFGTGKSSGRCNLERSLTHDDKVRQSLRLDSIYTW